MDGLTHPMSSVGGSSARVAPALRAVVVDDHDVFRLGLVRLLREEGIDVIGEASGGRAAIRLAEELRPEVVIMDLSMPGVDGIEATRRIVSGGSGTRVIVLSVSEEDEAVVEALVAGAAGFVRKDESLEKILEVLGAAARGDTVIPPRIGGEIVRRLQAQATSSA